MKNITIIVPETAVPAGIVDPRYMFTAALVSFPCIRESSNDY
jgi:hypothetical protein